MVICKKCGEKDLEWMKDGNRWRLYSSATGKIHDNYCKVTKEDFTESNVQKERKVFKESLICKHGILKIRSCPKCEEEVHAE